VIPPLQAGAPGVADAVITALSTDAVFHYFKIFSSSRGKAVDIWG